MATMENCWDVAASVYERRNKWNKDELKPVNASGFRAQKWEWGTWLGDGYQGGVFDNPTDVIVGFSGTNGPGGNILRAPISQNTANVRIAVNVVPNMAGSAFAMVRWAQAMSGNRPVSVVGHSLGGALAQVVGNWAGCPFVSFAGPGMLTHLRASAFNVFKPKQLVRSVRSTRAERSFGVSFVVQGDWMGGYGKHVGRLITLPASNENDRHSLEAIQQGLISLKLGEKTIAEVFDGPAGEEEAVD